MKHIGTIIRLQAQRSSLKVGPAQGRTYDPAAIVPVASLLLSLDGAVGCAASGEQIIDVHNHIHPASKNDGYKNGVSILFTPHYAAMRTRFGPHLTDGIAGESILVETERSLGEAEVGAGIVLQTEEGDLRLDGVHVAEPCVEFTRYSLGLPPTARSDATLLAALEFLRGGMRGFYARYDGPPANVRVGDRVYLAG